MANKVFNFILHDKNHKEVGKASIIAKNEGEAEEKMRGAIENGSYPYAPYGKLQD